jgi:uncharacterized protein (TIGR02118 family)
LEAGEKERHMLVVLVAAKRRTDISYENFADYWLNKHAPLVLSVPEFARHLRRYVIYPLLGHSGESDFVLGKFPGYDGIGELRFDDLNAMKVAFAEPKYLEIIRPDEDKFLDRDACLTFLTEERIQKG